MNDIETVVICCSRCGTIFIIPEALDVRYRQSHQGFYCPNGHTLSYPQETDADRWKKVADARQDMIDQLRTENEKVIRENRKLKKAVQAQDVEKVKK